MLKKVIPSYMRANDVSTLNLVKDCYLVVQPQEADEYKRYNEGKYKELIILPPEVKGIVKTRQYILEYFADSDIIMIDDDMLFVRDNSRINDVKIIDKDEVEGILQYAYNMSLLFGAKLRGFSNAQNPLEYTGHKPFEFGGFINANICGFNAGHGLNYDMRLTEAEDYYMVLLNYHLNRYELKYGKYTFIAKKPFTNKGGMQTIRNNSSLKYNTDLLKKIFGPYVKDKSKMKTKKNVREGERSIFRPR